MATGGDRRERLRDGPSCAVEYINDDTVSAIGSIFAAIYAKITRVCPEKAGGLATSVLLVGEKIEHARTMDQLEQVQDALERILHGVVAGLRDGAISSDGLETFKLGYEFVRDELEIRR